MLKLVQSKHWLPVELWEIVNTYVRQDFVNAQTFLEENLILCTTESAILEDAGLEVYSITHPRRSWRFIYLFGVLISATVEYTVHYYGFE